MKYDSSSVWTQAYANYEDISYPSEGVIRIFKGKFPDLHMPLPQHNDSIVDIGCGDGRHALL